MDKKQQVIYLYTVSEYCSSETLKYLHVLPLQQSTMSFTQSVWCSIDAI